MISQYQLDFDFFWWDGFYDFNESCLGKAYFARILPEVVYLKSLLDVEQGINIREALRLPQYEIRRSGTREINHVPVWSQIKLHVRICEADGCGHGHEGVSASEKRYVVRGEF